MKNFIIVGTISKLYQDFIRPDLSKSTFVNAKSMTKFNNNDYKHNEFFVKGINTENICFCCWLSSINKAIYRQYILLKDYDLNNYNKYIDTDIINVNKISEIPDYDGLMGVPVSILVFPTNQFEILGVINKRIVIEKGIKKNKFMRILIKKK